MQADKALLTSVSVVDTLLAATAIEAQLYFVTRNTRDARHAGTAVFNPREDEASNFSLIGVR